MTERQHFEEAPPCREIMTPDLVTVRPDDSVEDARREMKLGSFRHLPVVDHMGRLVGIVSQRDLVAPPASVNRVEQLMRSDIKSVGPDTPAYEAAYLLLRHKIGCVPVVGEGDRLVGLVTESDFVRVAYQCLGGRVPVDQLELEEAEASRV